MYVFNFRESGCNIEYYQLNFLWYWICGYVLMMVVVASAASGYLDCNSMCVVLDYLVDSNLIGMPSANSNVKFTIVCLFIYQSHTTSYLYYIK